MGIALIVLTIPIVLGSGLVMFLLSIRPNNPWAVVLTVCMGTGLGLGIVSVFYFVWALVLKFPVTNYWIAESVVLAFLVVSIAHFRRSWSASRLDTTLSSSRSIYGKALLVGFCATAVLALANVIALFFNHPTGEWDAWAFWNHKARLMTTCPQNFFETLWTCTNADYPYLLPGLLARCWVVIGEPIPAIAQLVAAAFGLATAGLLISTVRALRNSSQAYLAGLALLGTWFFLRLTSDQYADVPLSFFMLATLALMCLRDKFPERVHSVLALSGVMAGLAAWTKNEGTLFLASAFATLLLEAILSRERIVLLRKIKYFVCGAAPVMVLLVCIKVTFVSPNRLISIENLASSWDLLLEPARYYAIAKGFLMDPLTFRRWGYMAPLLFFYAIAVGLRTDARDTLAFWCIAIAPGIMLTGYFVVFLLVPRGLLQHYLDTGASRLLMQLWPIVLLMYFLAVSTIEEAASKR
jgi:hypothetical protein